MGGFLVGIVKRHLMDIADLDHGPLGCQIAGGAQKPRIERRLAQAARQSENAGHGCSLREWFPVDQPNRLAIRCKWQHINRRRSYPCWAVTVFRREKP